MISSSPVALVTGGGRNIGCTIALRLAQAGYDICVASLEADDVQVVSLEINAMGQKSLPYVVDIRNEEHVQKMFRKVETELGPVQLLVNNAGLVGPYSALKDLAKEDWDHVLGVNLTGTFLCCKAVLPSMMERRAGKIVNIGSAAGKKAYPYYGPYSASKWGLIGLTQALAQEVGEFNIQVNAVCPGPVENDSLRSVIRNRAECEGRSEEEVEAILKQSSKLGRFVRQEDVAEAVVFLASPTGDNITGQTIDITAGYGL